MSAQMRWGTKRTSEQMPEVALWALAVSPVRRLTPELSRPAKRVRLE